MCEDKHFYITYAAVVFYAFGQPLTLITNQIREHTLFWQITAQFIVLIMTVD